MRGGVVLSGFYEEDGSVNSRLFLMGHPYANEP